MERTSETLPTRARRRGTTVTAAGLALAAGLAGAGCAPNEISFFIVQNQVPVAGGTSSTCTISADPGALKSDQGLLDVLLRSNYNLSPLYRSELISYRDPTAGRAETRGITVHSAEIDLHLNAPDGPLVVPTFTVSLSTFIPPGASATPGYAVGTLEVVPVAAGTQLFALACRFGAPPSGSTRPTVTSVPQRVVAVIRPFGRTMGGVEVAGAPYTYPINVCCGCLIQFPSGSDDPDINGPDCRGGAPSTSVCDLGQDAPVDCRFCSTSNPYCSP